MTIKELITKLQEFDPDMLVFAATNSERDAAFGYVDEPTPTIVSVVDAGRDGYEIVGYSGLREEEPANAVKAVLL